MKNISLTFAFLLVGTVAGFSEGYQAQYPYDPYGGAPQPTASSQQYSQPHSGSDYKSLLSYGSFEAHYGFVSFSNALDLGNSSGFGANLNVKLLKPLFLHFGVNWLRGVSDTSSSKDVKMTSISAGGGAYIPFTDRFHLFGEVGLRYDVVEGSSYVSKDDFSVYVRPGIRVAVTEKFELYGDIVFNSTKNLNDRVYGVGGYYNIFDILDLGLGVDISEDVNTYRGGVRLRW